MASVDSASTHWITSTGPARIKHHARSPTKPTVVSVHASTHVPTDSHIASGHVHEYNPGTTRRVPQNNFRPSIKQHVSRSQEPKIGENARNHPVPLQRAQSLGGDWSNHSHKYVPAACPLAARNHRNRLIPGATRVSLANSPLMSGFGLGQASLLDTRFLRPACDAVRLLSLHPLPI